MPFPEVARQLVGALLTALLAWAAIGDIRTRKIPNRLALAVAALFVPWALLHWGPWVAWALVAGAIALAVVLGLFAFGLVGGGDAKLFAAVAPFAGLEHLMAFAAATALVGGLIAVVSLASRPRRALTMLSLRGKGGFGEGVPYGVAISAAGVLVVWTGLLYPTMLSGVGL